MLLRGVARRCLFVVMASVALYAGACSSDSNGEDEDSENPALADVQYAGTANDEGLEALLDAAAVSDAAKGPVITAPSEAADVHSPASFNFHLAGTSALNNVPCAPSGAVRELRQLWSAERLAHAHGAPMNGAGYLLTFASAAEPKLLRVFSTQTTYAPSSADWAKLTAAGAITLIVTAATFEEGRIITDGGPFVSAALHFTALP